MRLRILLNLIMENIIRKNRMEFNILYSLYYNNYYFLINIIHKNCYYIKYLKNFFYYGDWGLGIGD